MRVSLTQALAAVAATSAVARAGIAIAPIEDNQIVEKMSGDCFFGVTTPQGCGDRIEFSIRSSMLLAPYVIHVCDKACKAGHKVVLNCITATDEMRRSKEKQARRLRLATGGFDGRIEDVKEVN